MPDTCPLCGEVHEPGPVGEPGTAFAGIEFKVCPQIPADHFYEDREFATGPRGLLHKIEVEDEQ